MRSFAWRVIVLLLFLAMMIYICEHNGTSKCDQCGYTTYLWSKPAYDPKAPAPPCKEK